MGLAFYTFWHGGDLPPLEQLSLNSFLQNGHKVTIYTYEQLRNAPAGCELADASAVLPRDALFLSSDQPLGGFSDLFRFTLLRDQGGRWTDLDVVCLTATPPEDDYVFAEEEPGVYCTAVLALPRGSELAEETLWQLPRTGETKGPEIFSRVITALGYQRHARPTAEIYPIHWSETPLFFDPDRAEEVSERCRNSSFVHVWSSIVWKYGLLKTVAPPSGSYLARLYTAHGIEFPAHPRYDWPHIGRQIQLFRDSRALAWHLDQAKGSRART